MDSVDRALTAETIAALNVPFDHHTESFNEARTAGDEIIRPNDGAELQDGSFMRVMFITKDDDGAKILHGIRLLRNDQVDKRFSEKLGHHLMALLPCARNELCAILNTITDTAAIDSSLVSESLKNVVRTRHIIFTNTDLYWDEDKKDKSSWDNSEGVENEGTLYVRFKYVELADLKKRKVSEFQLRRVTRVESDVEHGIAPFWLLHNHRSSHDRSRRSNEKYTYTDICAGGGGTSQAAVLAGLTPKLLLDNNHNACVTLRLNFGQEVVLQSDVRDFCQLKESGNVVDVVHFSFSCQGHSSLNHHTNPEMDAENIALGYALSDILQMCNARVVTMVHACMTSLVNM